MFLEVEREREGMKDIQYIEEKVYLGSFIDANSGPFSEFSQLSMHITRFPKKTQETFKRVSGVVAQQ